jgi:hypothetical protein
MDAMRFKALAYVKQRVQSLFQRRPNHFITRLCEQTVIVVQGTNALVDYWKPSRRTLLAAPERRRRSRRILSTN